MANILNTKSIKHPNTFSISQGNTMYSKQITSINESIKLILTTAKGELFGDPNFGSNLYKFLFDLGGPNTPLETLIKEEISSILNTYETRIFLTDDDVSITYEGTTAKISIRYNLRYTDITASYQHIVKLKEDNQ